MPLCRTCHIRDAAVGCQRCQACLDINLATMRARWAAREAAGLPRATTTQDRALAGVCVDCGASELHTSRRCKPCAKRRRATAKQAAAANVDRGLPATTRDRWIAEGLCIRCGGPRDRGLLSCSSCGDKTRRLRAIAEPAAAKAKRAAGHCLRCTAPAVVGDYCTRHSAHLQDMGRARTTRYRLARKADGGCAQCSAKAWGNLRFCAPHHVRRVLSGRGFGSPDPAVVDAVVAKFNGRCAFTDLPLAPGPDLQLEHVWPVSSHPDHVFNLANLVWVHAAVNTAKDRILPLDPLLETFLRPDVVQRIRAHAAAVGVTTPPPLAIPPTP